MRKKDVIRIVEAVVVASFLLAGVFTGSALEFKKIDSSERRGNLTHLSYEIGFSEPVIYMTNLFGNNFSKIDVYDCIDVGEPGRAALPVHGVKILLPFGMEIKNVIVSGESVPYDTRGVDLVKNPIVPYQNPVPIGSEASEFSMDQGFYNSFDEYPSVLYDVVGVDYCRGYTILTMNIHPVKYIPGAGEMFYYPLVKVDVELQNTGKMNRFLRDNVDDQRWVESLVINPEITGTYSDCGVSFDYPGGICDPSDDYDYVIITRESLASFQATYNWSDLISRKQAEGLTATLVTVESIEACPDYWNSTPLFNDTAAKIREFCRDAYIDWGTQYVLIGGDDDGPASIPRREMDYSYESNVDSDLYWSNLDKTFNDDMDNDWGEEGDTGFDLYSELYIGSIPCDEGQDVSNWLTKSFYYADSWEQDYLDNVASYGGDTGWNCEGDDFMDFTLWGTDNWVGPNPGAHGPYPDWLGFLYGYDTWNSENPGMEFNTTQLHTAEPPNPGWMGDGTTGMKNAINSDLCTIIWGVAHANADMSLDVYASTWESDYHNTKPFFLHDYGCHCGDMDAADDGVLHAMLFHSDTELAFATVYNTCYGWGSFDDTNSSSALQQKLMLDYMLNTSKSGGSINWQLGKAMAYSKDAMAPTIDWSYSSAPGSWRGIIEGCLLFGDPAQLLKPPVMPEHNIGIKTLDMDDHVNPDTLMYINATLVNNGQNNESNVVVSFRVNGSEIDNVTIPFFETLTTQDVSFVWTPTKGWYVITVNVTIPGVVENITYDNEKTRILVAGPDVAVSSMDTYSYAIVNGSSKIDATIVNLGASDEIVNVYLKMNDTLVDYVRVFVPSKSSQPITLLWSPSYEGTYLVKVEAQVPGEVYSGNNVKSKTVDVISPQGFVLLVDDDKGQNYETYFQNALMAAGYIYEYWDRESQGCPTSAYMASHMAVVWFTGMDSTTTLVPEDIAALSTYLDNGGKLFITGQDIGYDIHTDPFYTNYLHATYGVDDTNNYYLDGLTGDPIGDNVSIIITGGDGANNQNWPSGIYPAGGGTAVFQYQSSSYYGAVKYEGVYKVVYFSFGFEAINNIGDRTLVMSRVMNWLGGGISNIPDVTIDPMNLYYVTSTGTPINDEFVIGNDATATENLTFDISLPQGFFLQWTHTHGSMGHSQLAQPVGDFDEDGVNEFLMGGYGSGGTYIYSYDAMAGTYVQEHFWTYSGGSYNVPSGACVLDLDDDGDLEFVVSWEYSGEDGIHAYDWDGSSLTELDWYTSVGVDFVYDVYACDYDDDGDVEVLIANDPSSSSGYHVTALAWNNTSNQFEREISWGSGQYTECPMVWSGDPDNDGKTEVIALGSSNSVYALNYNAGSWTSQIVATGLPAHPYGVACGDLDGDGVDEIGIGLDSTDAYIYKWNTTSNSYEQVWYHNYAGEDDIIEGIAIGDADNDGILEFLVAPSNVHIIKWDGNQYNEVYTCTESDGQIAGLQVGDFDTDGNNEVKACDIITGPGKEWIFKYIPEPNWITITPRNGTLLPGENTTISLSINTSNLTVGVTHLFIDVDTNDPDESLLQMPLYISIPSTITHTHMFYNGWNLITIPVENNFTASTLYSNITGCQIILRWNTSTSDFDVYVPSSPNDFPIENGIGYLVGMNQDTSFTVTGMPISMVNIPLVVGWNMLGWYHEQPTSASSLYNAIPYCSIVLLWNTSTSDFDIWVPGAPQDYTINQGDGFLVAVTQPSIWHGEG